MRFFKILLITVVCCSASVAYSQENDKLANTAAQETCACMNAFFNELHPQLLQLMHDMYDVGEAKAQANFENFLTTATEEDNARIAIDIDRMNNADAEIADYCNEVFIRYKAYDNDEAFNNKLLLALEQLENCSLVLKMMKMGE